MRNQRCPEVRSVTSHAGPLHAFRLARPATVVLALSVFGGLTGQAGAQAKPGTRLTVDVEVISATVSNSQTTISYRLVNRPTSLEQVFSFVVASPVPLLGVSLPSPATDWTSATEFAGQPAAYWAVLGEALMPGTTGPVLTMTGVGLPGLVDYWVRGFAPPPPLEETGAAVVPPTNVLATGSIQGRTLGIVSAPETVTASTLTARTREQLDILCGNGGLMVDVEVCTALSQQLAVASDALGRGDGGAASGALRAFLQTISAQRGSEPGKHVPETAYWLLRANASAALALI